MVGTFNTSLGTGFWWGLWDSGLLPTCFYPMSVRWTILPHYTHTHTHCVCVSASLWTPREQGQGIMGQIIWDSEPKYTFFPWRLTVWRFAAVIQSGLTAPPLSSGTLTITSLSLYSLALRALTSVSPLASGFLRYHLSLRPWHHYPTSISLTSSLLLGYSLSSQWLLRS